MCCNHISHRHGKIMKISTSDYDCRNETPVVSTCRHTKSKVSGLNSEKKFCAGVSRSERLGCGWGQDIREVRTNGMMHWAAWLRLRTKIQKFQLLILSAGMKPQSYPHVGTLNPKFQDWTRKKIFVLASAAVSGLAAAEDKNPKFWTWEFCLLRSISRPLPMS